MSNGTIPITPTPAKKPIDIWHVVLTALLSMAAAWITKSNVTPTPVPGPTPAPVVIVKPVVTPDVNPVPVNPQPVDPIHLEPIPAPVPSPVVVPPRPPTPINVVPPITTGLTVVDAKGNPLGNQVDSGVMFVVTCSPGFTMTPFPSSKADADIVEISDVKLICSLRNDCTLQIYVAGSGRPTLVSIQCNHGPQPPPVVVVVPPVVVPPTPPVPDPKPTPVDPVTPIVSKDLRVLIVEDVDKRSSLTADQMGMITGKVTRDWLKANCVKSAAGDPQFRIANKAEKLTGDWPAMASEVPTKFPWLFIQNGNAKLSTPLPETFEGLKPILDKYSGATP